MELVLLIVGVVILVFGYQWAQDQRENALAKRLERMRERDPNAVAAEIDVMRARARAEGETFARLRDRY